jgi:hypothetical protein
MSSQRVLIPAVFANKEEFERVLDQAEGNAKTEFEVEFIEDLKERYTKWGPRMFFSEKQEAFLDNLAWGKE